MLIGAKPIMFLSLESADEASFCSLVPLPSIVVLEYLNLKPNSKFLLGLFFNAKVILSLLNPEPSRIPSSL